MSSKGSSRKSENVTKGLGLRRQDYFSHGNHNYHLDTWLVMDGTIKCELSEIIGTDSGTGLPVATTCAYREFGEKDFTQRYMHTANFIAKVMADQQYCYDCAVDHPASRTTKFLEKRDFKPSVDSDDIARRLVIKGMKFEEAARVKAALDEL